jgi:ribonuclease G
VADGKEVAALDRDLRNLMQSWNEGITKLKTATPRTKIIGEMNRASSILRDVMNESFDSIVTDDPKIFDEVKQFIDNIAPEKSKIVRQYSNKAKIFERYGIEKQLKSLFGQTVSVAGGGYLVIEHTEALHVIDVNSGNKSNAETDQETTALTVNLHAAKEIARQLRLRDMGGIIVIDFIDMKRTENKKLLFRKMKEFMQDDRSKFTILPLTKFGLMQITRQRVRPELNITTKETCPTCSGSGKISASILVSDQVEESLQHLLLKQNEKGITLTVHPYLYAYFTKGIINKRMKWFFKYNQWIGVEQDSSLAITEFKFLNKEGVEIQISATV